MTKEVLANHSKEGSYNLDFQIDGAGITWGVSYVRFVVGERIRFKDLEHFFYCSLKSVKNVTSGLQGEKKWEERVDFEKWALGLKVNPVTSENLIKFVDASKNEIIEHLKHWEEENTIDVFQLNLPDKFDFCWLIEETVYPRHYINWTETYLAETSDRYYCIEGHWES